jgi:hypothetical protein
MTQNQDVQPREDDRKVEAAKNQSFFREVNERVTEYATGAQAILDILCECDDTTCVDPIPVSHDEYEAVRAYPSRFPIHPGHVSPDVERVVERHDRYWVVQKVGRSGEVAEDLDPRTRGGAAG